MSEDIPLLYSTEELHGSGLPSPWQCEALFKAAETLERALASYYPAGPSGPKGKEKVRCHPLAVAKDSLRLTYTLLYVYRGRLSGAWLPRNSPVFQKADFQMLLIAHTQAPVTGASQPDRHPGSAVTPAAVNAL